MIGWNIWMEEERQTMTDEKEEVGLSEKKEETESALNLFGPFTLPP